MRTALQISSLLVFSLFTCRAQVTDFSLAAAGPHHVVRGNYVTFNVVATVISGTDTVSGTVPSVTGTVAGMTVSFPNLVRFCCGTFMYRVAGTNPITITTTPTTATGSYTVQIKYVTPSGVTRTTPWVINVDAVPVAPTPVVIPPPPLLTGYSQWKANGSVYGKKHCTTAEINPWNEASVNYYDGARVYYQLAVLEADTTLNPCGDLVNTSYRAYIDPNNGGLPGYRVFPQGLVMNYQMTMNPATLNSFNLLYKGGGYTIWPDVSYIVDWAVSRETAFGIETNLWAQVVGSAPNPHFQDLVEVAIGHFDQWFQSKSSPIVQPFMVALSSEALIQYYDKTKDTRVFPLLQMAADSLWANSWNVGCQCFNYYQDTPPDPTHISLSQDLNGLIAPLYGWVYMMTGQTKYRDEGDQVFNGTLGAYLDGGKQFSQTYRWSGKYVDWRGGPGGNVPVAPVLNLSCSAGTLTFTPSSSGGSVVCK